MGAYRYEPESSGHEPKRIDQATPRTRAPRGTPVVGISVARGCVSMRSRFGILGSSDCLVLRPDTQRRDLISTASNRCVMDQLQMEPRARKKKKSSKLEFDASQ